jgi:diguanylate cyclase (GGDEF)-like protein/PAS domain S-box-containing protein
MNRERLLIVEDEKIIALDLQRRLEKFGYQVVALSTTGRDAIAKAEEHKPDIILMDIMLAGDIDGIEAAKVINKQFQIPLIFLTAYADEKTLERAKEAEPFGYILKPFKEKELYTTIDIALYKHRIDNQLKSQERRFSAILHSIEDGIIATDHDNNIQFMNPIAEKVTGWREENAIGKPLLEVMKLVDERTQQAYDLPTMGDGAEMVPSTFFKDTLIVDPKENSIPVEGTIAQIIDRNESIEGQVIALRDITKRKELSDTISYQASHDALTGLANRNEFSYILSNLIDSSKAEQTQHAFLYLDLDQFRLINDTSGHAAGDEFLLETTAIIKSVVRGSDICARLGGDEFGIILKGSTEDQALSIAQRLHSRLSERKLVWNKSIYNIHSSIGLVMITPESEDIHTVLAAADDACYLAKDEGGRRIKTYDLEDNRFKKRRGEMHWISHLTKALDEERFVLYYQPIKKLSDDDDKHEKCEILLRMVDEEGNIVPPADFIPAAERYNLMPTIDQWVIRTAFKTYRDLLDRNESENLRRMFTINLSAESIADESFLGFIHHNLKEYQVPPEGFCFEITETVTISNMATASMFISELKKLGCTFALDDFGSGFSSFGYLKTMPVDYLKIDGSFVRDMDENPVNAAMVEAINNMGHIMQIKTIAEFVKNGTIMENLQKLGVNYAQGYHIAKPAPLTDLTKTIIGE